MTLKKNLIICFLLYLTLCFTNCDDKDSDVKSDPREAESEPFVIPDSINTSLLIAMFDENEPAGHAILIYGDTGKATAKKIKYHFDKSVTIEKLTPTGYRELRSEQTNTVYMIKEKSVTVISGGPPLNSHNSNGVSVNNIAAVKELKRTDTHLREYDVMIDK